MMILYNNEENLCGLEQAAKPLPDGAGRIQQAQRGGVSEGRRDGAHERIPLEIRRVFLTPVRKLINVKELPHCNELLVYFVTG